MARRSAPNSGPWVLEGCQPPVWQTPGRLQYYKAENEPFLPDEVKWGLRLPTTRAHRALTLDYEEKVREQVLVYLGTTVTHDYLDGNRDLNLDLTMAEAEQLFNANDKIRNMA